ncbi:MaoC family dehydratase [Nocardia pseudovaccinii]|uniref:MaoC family dehydratase n=1 Tax=Nocardia pseudovaccinii TaxID=189540 RepID=UPI003D8A5114
MRVFRSATEVLVAVGTELGHSEWLTITQDRVNRFAEATGDRQWIHVDVERATTQSPFGGPIAHGFLTLSLIPTLSAQIYRFDGVRLAVNYGSDKIRYPSPVPVGSKVQLTSTLSDASELPDGALQLSFTHTVSIVGRQKPAVVAEMIVRVMY